MEHSGCEAILRRPIREGRGDRSRRRREYDCPELAGAVAGRVGSGGHRVGTKPRERRIDGFDASREQAYSLARFALTYLRSILLVSPPESIDVLPAPLVTQSLQADRVVPTRLTEFSIFLLSGARRAALSWRAKVIYEVGGERVTKCPGMLDPRTRRPDRSTGSPLARDGLRG